MTVSVRAMEVYVAVLDAGNFSEVARRESISPSSVSRIVMQLEEAVGVQLLYRNTRAIVPTEAGRVYGQTFRRMLDELALTAQQIRERESEPSGLVRINAPVVFGQKHIAPWLPGLMQRYPRLEIELLQTDDYIDPLTDAADLLFRIGPLADSLLHCRVVDRPAYFLAAGAGYLAQHGVPQTPADLAQHNCLVYKGQMGVQRSYCTPPGGRAEVCSLRSVLQSNNAETLVSAALGNAGIVMMPDWLISGLLQQKQLVRVLPEYQVASTLEEQVIAMLYPHARFLPLNVRTVIDFFAARFGSPSYWKYN